MLTGKTENLSIGGHKGLIHNYQSLEAIEMFITGEWVKKLWRIQTNACQKCPGRKEPWGHQKTRRKKPILLRERNQPETSILWGSKHPKVWKKQRAETVKRKRGQGERRLRGIWRTLELEISFVLCYQNGSYVCSE